MNQEPISRRAATADARERISRLQAGEEVKSIEIGEAAERLVALLNELGAAGIEVEAAICGLNLSTDVAPYGARVEPVDQTRTTWEIC